MPAQDQENEVNQERVPLVSRDAPASVAAEPQHLGVTVLRSCSLAAMYIAVSASMILFNKYLLNEERFPYATALTTLHMMNSLCMSTCLYWACPSYFPTAHHVFGPDMIKRPQDLLHVLAPFTQIAFCGAISYVAGNSAYKYSSVAFLQMVKESHIVFVYFMMVFVGLDQLRQRTVLILVFVAISAAVAVYGDVVFSVTGLALQILAGTAGSWQQVLTNLLMSRSQGPRLDPMTMVLCTAPMVLIFLIPASIYFWDSNLLVQAKAWWPYLVVNTLLAFTLQVTSMVTIKGISATGQSLASVLKDVSIVAAAGLILHESMTAIQIGGFISTVIGILMYSAVKLHPEIRLCPCWGGRMGVEDKAGP
mmetsp:Transcript_69011/g.128905  ORF Transcript_69011/g.128905 Transcript_69011/m.128905 type:complete len:364 (+) Transcript_69011:81-1172(+)